MQEAEDRYKNGQHTLTDFMGNEPSKKRKRRTSFTPQALEVLNAHFEEEYPHQGLKSLLWRNSWDTKRGGKDLVLQQEASLEE
ncbi:POU domain, class 6, transcription factor 2, partial [Armadillidium nasatum]